MDTDKAPRACTVSRLESILAFPSESSHGIILAGVKRLWALAPWHLGSHLNDFRSGSRNLQIHRGKSWPCMHHVWIGVDSGVPVRKLTRYHVIFMCYLAKGRFWSSPVRSFPLESIGIFRPLGFFRPTPRKNIWSNLVQSFLVRCQGLGIQDLTPVSHECTVPGLMESIRAFRSESSSGIM